MIINSQTSLFCGFLCRHVSPLCLLEQCRSSHSKRLYLEHSQKYRCSCANHYYPTREMYTKFQCLSKTLIYLQLFRCYNNCPYPSSPVSDYFDAIHVGPASCCLIPLQPSCSTRRWDSEDRPLGFLSLSDHQTDSPDAAALFMPAALWPCFSPGQCNAFSPEPLSLLGPASSPSVLLEQPEQLLLRSNKPYSLFPAAQRGNSAPLMEFLFWGKLIRRCYLKTTMDHERRSGGDSGCLTDRMWGRWHV